MELGARLAGVESRLGPTEYVGFEFLIEIALEGALTFKTNEDRGGNRHQCVCVGFDQIISNFGIKSILSQN